MGREQSAAARAIATATTAATWLRRRAVLKPCGCEDDREGKFHTQVFERYRRDAPHVADGLTEMFVDGVRTHKVGRVAQTLMDVAPSAISLLNRDLEQQFRAWHERRLPEHWRVLYAGR